MKDYNEKARKIRFFNNKKRYKDIPTSDNDDETNPELSINNKNQ